MSTIRETFFNDKAKASLWDVAVSLQRGNPLPLDANSVFQSYADLQAYAADVLAYPGQIVAVVNEDSTGIYYLDQNLAIQEVGKIPTADNKSVEINDEVISLHDFGKVYYKYIAEVKDEETGAVTPAHYEKTIGWVDKALEPKVVSEDGVLVLGWFEPNPTTIEGVNSQVAVVQAGLEDVKAVLGTPAEEGKEATGLYAKANAKDVYTKTEADAKITEEIAKFEHLARKTFDTLELAQTFADESENPEGYIYMVKSSDGEQDMYDEYLYIDEHLEKVGAWETDLTDYAKTADVEEALGKKVDAVTGKSLVDDTEIAKLATIAENAEANYINEVEADEFDVTDRKLSVKEIAQSKVTGLEDALAGKADASDVEGIDGRVEVVEGKVKALEETTIPAINSALNDKATKEALETLAGTVTTIDGELDAAVLRIDAIEGALETKVESEVVEAIDGRVASLETFKTTVDGRVSSLESQIATKAESSVVETLSSKVNGIDTRLGAAEGKVADLESAMNNYVLTETFNAEMNTVKESITWGTLQ